jgi:hypothetical protein
VKINWEGRSMLVVLISPNRKLFLKKKVQIGVDLDIGTQAFTSFVKEIHHQKYLHIIVKC